MGKHSAGNAPIGMSENLATSPGLLPRRERRLRSPKQLITIWLGVVATTSLIVYGVLLWHGASMAALAPVGLAVTSSVGGLVYLAQASLRKKRRR